jgi:hypothetical protein
MKHKLSLAVALALAAGAMSHRALAQIPSSLTPSLTMNNLCFNLTIGYIPSGNFEVYFVPGGPNPWEIWINFNSLGFPTTPAAISGYAQHFVGPHPGEVPINTPWLFSFLAPPGGTAGPTNVPHPVGSHFDQFYAQLNQVQGGWLLNVTGCHIPEPADYAALAGLGLVGFGAYRRFRKA